MLLSVLLAILQCCLIIAIVLFEYKRRSVAVFLWAMLLLMFGVMHCYTVFSFSMDYPLWVYNNASIFVILFSIVYLISRYVLVCNKTCVSVDVSLNHHEYVTKAYRKYVYVTFFVLVVAVAYKLYTISIYSGGILDSSWSSRRDMLGGQQGLSKMISNIMSCLFYYGSASILLFKRFNKNEMSMLSLSLVLVTAVVSRQRIDLLPVFVVALTYVIYRNDSLNIKKILALISIGGLAVLFIYALQIYRYYGSLGSFIDRFDFVEFINLLLFRLSEGEGDIGLREVFYYFIYNDNNFEGFERGHTYIRMLLFFLPTSWSFGIKPPDFAITMGTAMKTGLEGYSVHPTLFGDCFANFGYWGFLTAILWAYIVKVVDDIVNHKDSSWKIVLIIFFANSYIIVGRGSVYNSFIVALYGFFLIWLIRHMFIGKRKR